MMKQSKLKQRPRQEDVAPKGLGANLRDLRQAKGWTQTELATRIGVHLTHVSRVELGRITPGLDFVLKAAKALGVTVDVLVTESDGTAQVRIENKDLAERLRLVEALDEDKRDALMKVIDSMLTEHRMRQLLEQKAPEKAAAHAD